MISNNMKEFLRHCPQKFISHCKNHLVILVRQYLEAVALQFFLEWNKIGGINSVCLLYDIRVVLNIKMTLNKCSGH